MVAVINTGHSIRGIFTYNENKVSSGQALCIGEGNYPMDIEKMTHAYKLNLLLKRLELNDNVKRSSVHISLNFDRLENMLSKEKLMEIAAVYMEKIGFGAQPFLVYQHLDAAHPHIHIVTVKVKADGSRIDMHNIGRNRSETARKEIEKTFNLVRADSKKNIHTTPLQAINIEKIKYGTVDSKRAAGTILNEVIPQYKYTTLGELNAVLNLYNLRAERGKENSKMFQNKGLIYQILDDKKRPVGVPIKASSFYSKPTLSQLEINFVNNKKTRITDIKRIKNNIDLAFLKNTKTSLLELETTLSKEGILCIYRESPQGGLYGITYVDHTTKCSCNGSVLGPQYAAKAIQERCGMIPAYLKEPSKAVFNPFQSSTALKSYKPFISETELQKIIDAVLQPEFGSNYIANQFKRKRKRKGQSGNQ